MPGFAADVPTLIPFALLLASVVCLWFSRTGWIAALIAAVVAAYFTGALTGPAFLWIALLGAAAWMYGVCKARAGLPRAGLLRLASGVALFLLAVVMGLALLPGFPRAVAVDSVVLSPGALPWSLGLGFPKVVTGIFIIGLIHRDRVRSWRELGTVLARAASAFLVTALAVMVLALALGYVKFDPRWTPLFLPWAIANLFFTCLSEEAFFRGFVQRELSDVGANRKLASIAALVLSASLFGLVHLGGGWKYALAATLAGAGYGWAYLRTQRIEAAMAVHFALNATHFLLFTYPALA
jgi:membrane protease YdiL (CAAX protease family)